MTGYFVSIFDVTVNDHLTYFRILQLQLLKEVCLQLSPGFLLLRRKPSSHTPITHHSLLFGFPFPSPICLLRSFPRSIPSTADLTSDLHPTHKNFTQKLQAGHKHTQQTRDAEMADTSANIQPAALIPDHPEEIQRQHVADGHDDHEQAARSDAQTAVQDAQVRGDEGERDEEFEEEEGALGEGVEDGDEAVDGVEGEGGDGGDVAGGEEGGLEEVEKEEGDAGVGEGEGSVGGCGRCGTFVVGDMVVGCRFGFRIWGFAGRLELLRNVG